MAILFMRRFVVYLTLTILSIGTFALYLYVSQIQFSTFHDIGVVTHEDVINSVNSSGKVETSQSAHLGFPVVGIIQTVYKHEGERVSKGEVLASLIRDSLVAEYNSAREKISILTHQKASLISGASKTTRNIARTNVLNAMNNLDRVRREHDLLVKNAQIALRSTELEAFPTSATNDDVPPTITGNYLCETEGSYKLTLFGSKSVSGISYTLDGLEHGTFMGSTDTPSPLGTCGLYIQFDASELYRPETWTISIPNKRSDLYITNLNDLNYAITERENAIRAAEEELELAQKTEEDVAAPPLQSNVKAADAQIAAAKAELLAYEARILDYTIQAPFDGVITHSNLNVGEPTDPTKRIVIAQEGGYKLKARISEMDVKRVYTGARARIVLDADPKNPIDAVVTFISPLSTQVDGASYYEAHLAPTLMPEWIREGLNADIHITIEESLNTTALKKQYIQYENSIPFVYILKPDNTTEKTPVEIGLVGTNGFVEVFNLKVGTMVVGPQ